MAAQYDVNLEKCALLKCLCGSAFAAGQAPVRSLALKISVIFGQGMGVILPGVERDFPPVFSWDWDGKRLKFVMHFGNRR